MNSPKIQTENDKINANSDLISYYQNISTSTRIVKNVGIVVIAIIVTTIGIILIVLYRKNNK